MSLINYVVFSQWLFVALLQGALKSPFKGWCVLLFYLYGIWTTYVIIEKLHEFDIGNFLCISVHFIEEFFKNCQAASCHTLCIGYSM